jgi:3-hydroxyisobutyrate dehydrogenase
MEAVGVIGLGKIGAPMAENLIRSGFKVVGYRRSPTPDLEQHGLIRAASPAEVGAQCNVVLSCLPNIAALDETVSGPNGLLKSARAGQIVVELGSYKVADKARQLALFEARGAKFLDGEVSGTAGMVAVRKAAVYLAGDEAACHAVEPIMKGFSDTIFHLGAFGAATKVKLINNHLLAVNLAATAEAMAVATKAGIDVPSMIKAISAGSGGSSAFAVRAQAMADRKFMPPMGTSEALEHYLVEAKVLATECGRATPMLDRAAELYANARAQGVEKQDVAVMIQVLENLSNVVPARKKGLGFFGRS